VISGKRPVSLILLTLLGAFAAADAGRVGEDGTGTMWVAPELLGAVEAAGLLGCTGEAVAHPTDLPAHGKVTFEWHPETGELSFDGSKLTLPEDLELSTSTPAAQSCGSR
jgi:hypothetical protein